MLTPWLECAAAGGDERGHRAGLVDPFFQDLPVDRLAVVEHVVGIDRLVKLAGVGVDAELAEEGLHAEGAGFVGHDGHDVAADVLVAQQPRPAAARRPSCSKPRGLRCRRRTRRIPPTWAASARIVGARRPGTNPPSAAPVLAEIDHFRAVLGRLVELGVGRLLVGDGDVEAAAELAATPPR